MKKFLTLMGLLVLAALPRAAMADTEALYWQVNQTQDPAITFEVARVVALDSNGRVAGYLQSEGGSYYIAANNDNVSTAQAQSLLGSYGSTGYSFAIELCTWWEGRSGSLGDGFMAVAVSEVVDYNALSQAIVSSGLPTSFGSVSAFGATGLAYTAVPEPSGALLFLLGGALVALRRRRRV